MTHKQFQHNTEEGGTDVQFNIEYDGQNSSILNIQLHSSFVSGLPHSVYLEYNHDNSKWQLCTYYSKEDENKNIIPVREWLNSEIANNILEKILQIKEEETPKFGNN